MENAKPSSSTYIGTTRRATLLPAYLARSINRRRTRSRSGRFSSQSRLRQTFSKLGGLPVLVQKERLNDLTHGIAHGMIRSIHCERVLIMPIPKDAPAHVDSLLQIPR